MTLLKVPFGVVPIENPGSGLLKEALTCFLESTLKVSASIQIPLKDGAAFERYFVIGPILPTLTDQVSHFIVMFTTTHEPGSLLKGKSGDSLRFERLVILGCIQR